MTCNKSCFLINELSSSMEKQFISRMKSRGIEVCLWKLILITSLEILVRHCEVQACSSILFNIFSGGGERCFV